MINKIEEILINADPSAKTILDNGFLIRCYNTNEDCVINRIAYDDRINVPEIVRKHTKKLAKIGLKPLYRIIYDKTYEGFDNALIRQNFSVQDRGVVFMLGIENMEKELFAFANFYESGIMFDEELTDEWIEDYCYMMGYDESYEANFRNNLENYAEDRMYFALVRSGSTLACGYATIMDEFFVINNIVVERKYRNLDYGKMMVKAMLTKGLSRGCKVALCEVREGQDTAIRMLTKEGFDASYSFQHRGR